MKGETFEELAGVFQYRWKAVILSLLAERPRRYSNLRKEIIRRSGEEISDPMLTWTLRKLTVAGLVVRETAVDGHRAYRATPYADPEIRLLRRVGEIVSCSDLPGGRRF